MSRLRIMPFKNFPSWICARSDTRTKDCLHIPLSSYLNALPHQMSGYTNQDREKGCCCETARDFRSHKFGKSGKLIFKSASSSLQTGLGRQSLNSSMHGRKTDSRKKFIHKNCLIVLFSIALLFDECFNYVQAGRFTSSKVQTNRATAHVPMTSLKSRTPVHT